MKRQARLTPLLSRRRLIEVSCVILSVPLLGCGGAPRPAQQSPGGERDGDTPSDASALKDAGARTDASNASERPGALEACTGEPLQLQTLRAQGSFEEQLQGVRAQLAELRAASFVKRSERAGDMLRQLAATLASAPEAQNRDATGICEIEQQARTLVTTERAPFEDCARIKRGLSIAVDILQEQAQRRDTQRRGPWVASARRAVQGIDEQSLVSFQGPEIQDAFRATVDALTALAAPSE